VVLVELLLEQALLKQSKNRLLDHFNSQLPAADTLDRFAELVVSASPVVIVESTIPYVEQVIAGIVDERTSQSFDMCRGSIDSEDSGLTFSLPSSGPAVVMMPLGIHRKVQQVDRLLFDMASRRIGAIVACDRADQLPESLRRAKDVVLRLPALDADIFASWFERVLGVAPPSGWRRGSTAWVRHAQPADLEHARRMGLSARDALKFIRGKVADQLASVDSRKGLRLDQLDGMSEARQWAEDLIADIHAAMSGRLSWNQVDTGALLVGPPGSGKTSLANAIARDCGVRFVRGSASTWMAEGVHLGPHIQAIRRTFREARDFAPSILFIDEIDGLGSREMLTGDNNSIYQTEVINAVLEQMQGIDPLAPVVVIGATNHEDRVDPALRRSGRLDRVIHIPRPNAEALQKIFRYYLKGLGPDIAVERGIDVKLLAGMSVGLTGADVERHVRGAGRRARKQERAVSENDLIDEITAKPRRTHDTLRLSPGDLERTAVHEAGHALAAFLGPDNGSDIAYSTIIPRDDGTLGFVARMPDDRLLLTRRDFEDTLEVWLGGRAAEEIRYGADGVSSGASSDLTAATGLVGQMVTRSGTSGNGKLLVSDGMSDADRAAAETILAQAYGSILRKLRENEARLDALAAELVARQELSGAEVRAVLKSGRRASAAKG
jgi:ATP-dependent Zn protease